MSNITFTYATYDSQSAAALPQATTIVVVGKQSSIIHDSTQAILFSKLNIVNSQNWFSQFVGEVKAGEKGSSASTLLPCGDKMVKVGVVVVPTVVSRHNSPSRADVIPSLLSPFISAASASITVLVLTETASVDSVVPVMAAIARATPLFSLKTAATTPLQVNIVISAINSPPDAANSTPTTFPPKLLGTCRIVVDGIRHASDIIDRPTNELHCSSFVRVARALCTSLPGVTVDVIEGEDLHLRGFGCIYGVGKAALYPPALVILSYSPPGCVDGEQGPVLVGKGIVYDTGGLSIKSSDGMPGMKVDMAGAGAILHTFICAVNLNYPHPLSAILCLAENSVSEKATRPDDIHTSYSGKTVEVNNTDAEGRLVLADGVSYAAKHLNPSMVIDMATLTGAQGIATGQRHAAIVCNDDALEAKAILAGRATGDLVHPLVFCPEFFMSEFKSEVADMKNSVKNRANASSSAAACFIHSHLEASGFSGPWLHIDMASPATVSERSTGYGMLLLLRVIGAL